jgi:hypothetical protein
VPSGIIASFFDGLPSARCAKTTWPGREQRKVQGNRRPGPSTEFGRCDPATEPWDNGVPYARFSSREYLRSPRAMRSSQLEPYSKYCEGEHRAAMRRFLLRYGNVAWKIQLRNMRRCDGPIASKNGMLEAPGQLAPKICSEIRLT